jgi:hypothetical protein
MILVFYPFSMRIGIALCTREKKYVINIQWTDLDFIEMLIQSKQLENP